MRKVKKKNNRSYCLPFDISSGTIVCFSSFNIITKPIGKRFKQIAEHSKRTDHIMGFVLDFIPKRTHREANIHMRSYLSVDD